MLTSSVNRTCSLLLHIKKKGKSKSHKFVEMGNTNEISILHINKPFYLYRKDKCKEQTSVWRYQLFLL